ncbi:MAG: methyl-accepting chemotaxis protein, partial [Rhodoferax sp.]
KALLSVYETGLPVLDHLLAVRIDAMIAKRIAMIFIALLSVLVALYLFYAFYLVTRDGLRLISLHLREMADGDLRRTPSLPLGRDEPALVLNDLRKAYDALHRLLHAVDRSVQELQGTAQDISSSSQSLAQRTEQAAANLEQQSATMDHIGSTASHSAELIQHASSMAHGNAQVSNQGGAVIDKVVLVMQGINLSSRKIADIIGTIDGITFQTNILALNAAVEAARAGESGRGFAVVATEVRALAQRSATAAREINVLISDSVRQVELGSDVVRHAGATMKEILENASQIEKVLDEVLVGAREQAVAVKQVGQAIQSLDVDTQQNASMVEQTTATAQSLKAHADELMVEMGSFRL